jgi:hypothetical protein
VITIMWRETAKQLEEAVFMLREQLAEASEVAAHYSPAMGCCGCGAWMADVVTPPTEDTPNGESYCWRCVDRHRIARYVVLPGRSL